MAIWEKNGHPIVGATLAIIECNQCPCTSGCDGYWASGFVQVNVQINNYWTDWDDSTQTGYNGREHESSVSYQLYGLLVPTGKNTASLYDFSYGPSGIISSLFPLSSLEFDEGSWSTSWWSAPYLPLSCVTDGSSSLSGLYGIPVSFGLTLNQDCTISYSLPINERSWLTVWNNDNAFPNLQDENACVVAYKGLSRTAYDIGSYLYQSDTNSGCGLAPSSIATSGIGWRQVQDVITSSLVQEDPIHLYNEKVTKNTYPCNDWIYTGGVKRNSEGKYEINGSIVYRSNTTRNFEANEFTSGHVFQSQVYTYADTQIYCTHDTKVQIAWLGTYSPSGGVIPIPSGLPSSLI